MRWARQDYFGFLVAVALTSIPVSGLIWICDQGSKAGPIGWPLYPLPLAVTVASAVLSSGVARVIGRDLPDRMGYHALFGVVTSLVLVVNFCGWWGELHFAFCERFRT